MTNEYIKIKTELLKKIDSLDEEIYNIKNKIAKLENEKHYHQSEIDNFNYQIKEKTNRVKKYDAIIEDLSIEIEKNRKHKFFYEREIEEYNYKIEDEEYRIKKTDKIVNDLNNELEYLYNDIEKLRIHLEKLEYENK